MHVTIRILTGQDMPAYRLLRLFSLQSDPLAFSESYEDESERTEENFAGELKTRGTPPEKFTLGAFNKAGSLTGFVRFVRDTRSKARHKAFVHGMYVLPEYRSAGTGSLLMGDLLEYARKLPGLEQIHLWVLHAGGAATGFYKKYGFKSQGTVVKNDLKIGHIYVDAEYMVLYL